MTQKLTAHSRLRHAQSILETRVDDEIVLMSMESGTCYGLDAIGSGIWEALKTPMSITQLQDICCGSYRGDPASIREDVCRLLDELLSEGLITSAD